MCGRMLLLVQVFGICRDIIETWMICVLNKPAVKIKRLNTLRDLYSDDGNITSFGEYYHLTKCRLMISQTIFQQDLDEKVSAAPSFKNGSS